VQKLNHQPKCKNDTGTVTSKQVKNPPSPDKKGNKFSPRA